MKRLPGLRELSQAANGTLTSNALPWTVLCLGILLRVLPYLQNPSLWMDEISLSLNIEERTYSGLLKPLSLHQAAPIGFLMLEKLAVQAFGFNEYALRLLPLLAGVLSLFLFFELAKRCLAPMGALIALFFFATGDKLIYYSSEVKQYSTDVAIGLLLLLVAVDLHGKKMSWRNAAKFGALGALLIWFSHPSIFVLAGVGTMLTLYNAHKKDWSNAALLSIAGLVWVASFAGSYSFTLRDTASSTYLEHFWGSTGAFMPLSIRSISEVQWFVRAFFQTLKDPGGFALPVVAALGLLFGFVSVFTNRKRYVLLLLSPIPFVLIASGLHKYPFSDRLLLFIVPSLFVFVAEGITRLLPKTPLIGLALVGFLCVPLLVNAVGTAIRRDAREDIKPALSYLREHWQQGDLIYVYHGAKRQFVYYAEKYGFTKDDYIKGSRPPEGLGEFAADVESLRGNRRVWTVFLVDREKGVEERAFLLQQLDSGGPRLDSFEIPGVSVYLYDLSGKAHSADQQRN